MSKGFPGVRYAEVEREASGIRVRVIVDLDGGTKRDVATGICFFDRLLAQLAYYAHLDLGVEVDGGSSDDPHAVLKEVGITFGQALKASLVESEAPSRSSCCTFVKDDALVQIAIDTGGRGQLFYDLALEASVVAQVPTQDIKEFLRGLVIQAAFTAHVRRLAGDNDHHIIEALFKGFGQALHTAVHCTDR